MTEELKQKMEEEIIKLPKEKREAINDFDWAKKTEEIGKKHLLTEDEINDFQLETGLVLIGLVDLDLYLINIENEIGTSKDEAEKIALEVFNEVFTPISTSIEIPIKNKSFILDPIFSSLPQSVQEAIANSGWKEKLYEIAGKYKLTVEQMGILEEITIKVMKNEILPNKYEEELVSKITISKEDISNLVNDINENILKRIREVMQDQRNEEEIPLPPYSKSEEKELEVPKPPKENKIQIENITMPDEHKNIVEEKLKGTTLDNHNASDYLTPKIITPSTSVKDNNGNPLPRSFDPYRETF